MGLPRLWLRRGGLPHLRGPTHALQVTLWSVLQVREPAWQGLHAERLLPTAGHTHRVHAHTHRVTQDDARTHGVTAAGTGCGLELPPVALPGWQPHAAVSLTVATSTTPTTVVALDCDRDSTTSCRFALFCRHHHRHIPKTPHRYITSMYWAYTTMTTVGYGDISSTTLAEKIWAIITMIVSGFFFSFVVGRMANIVAKLDSHRTAYNERMEVVTAFLKDTNLPRPLEKRCAP